MRRPALAVAAASAALLAAAPAAAQLREYCPERPGLDTPACIVDKGHVSLETGVVDWTLDRQPDSRTDTITIAQTLVRLGVTDRLEVRASWEPFGHERVRDVASGAIDRADRVGDAVLGLKASLLHPDGQGLAIAVLPSVSLPVGRVPIGAGGVGYSLLLPVSYDLSDTVRIDATPSVRGLPNDETPGHHLRYGSAGGVTVKVTKAVSLSAEAQVVRDAEPGDHTTRARTALSVAWQPQDDWQLDLFGIAGLNRDTPDLELSAGIARRF
ncbi:transporter [Sphingomonas sp. CLY1604]|uniref:transporter n=1 Tax=Sphingomonas sp. CLY1604 TaxID=3457786 RepID=UPI003FD85A01